MLGLLVVVGSSAFMDQASSGRALLTGHRIDFCLEILGSQEKVELGVQYVQANVEKLSSGWLAASKVALPSIAPTFIPQCAPSRLC